MFLLNEQKDHNTFQYYKCRIIPVYEFYIGTYTLCCRFLPNRYNV